MDKQRKKDLASQYTQSFRRMGIYQIRNTDNGKILVCSAMDLDGARNRLLFTQQTNVNSMSALQQDWNRYGGACFVFEELDELKPEEEFADPEARKKYKGELEALLELWLEKLQPYEDRGYNRRAK
ncbi:GIY-YIG nuclease family protein [Paenibacillus pinistramenti]|uniref:GIY-YIG nuclease family protein n=1 Tax=Paenibacillus pinistramenti TaxID=1768003 RepID=UPI0011095307|nr:GIY-YIG nuclease family protein [Paenibacillus pinistramenti]